MVIIVKNGEEPKERFSPLPLRGRSFAQNDKTQSCQERFVKQQDPDGYHCQLRDLAGEGRSVGGFGLWNSPPFEQ